MSLFKTPVLLLCLVAVFQRAGTDELDFGPWSRWSACSQYCEQGVQFRTRPCIRDGDCRGKTLGISTCYKTKCYLSCHQYLEDNYKSSGVYQLFVDGPCKRPVKTICDQSKLYGGGWTLLVQVISNSGWNQGTVLQRNSYASARKLKQSDFSILGKANAIKSDSLNKSPFYYRLDAKELGRWGGVWQAPNHYTFTGTFSNLTGVSLIKKFDNWTSGPFAISNRMPWLPKGDEFALLTTNNRVIQEIPWGTIVTRKNWPSPWIYEMMPFPKRMWYWLKENKKAYKEPDVGCPVQLPLPVDGGYNSWSAWSECSRTCSTGFKVRGRFCNNPRPANGGKDCSRLGPPRETLVCKPWPPCDGFPKHSPLRSSNGLCLSPKHHSCTASESEPLVFDSDCISDSTWFLLRDDGTLQHACSEMCVRPLISSGAPIEWTPVGLSSYACDDQTQRFQKTQGMAHGKAIQYRAGGMCLQSISGNTPAKGDIVSLGKKCMEGSDAYDRVFTFPHPDCAYGLQTGLMGDSHLSSTSMLSSNYAAPYGRLRNRTSAWCPRSDDKNPYFKVDLGYPDEIKGVATQGKDIQDGKYWFVRSFAMSFSLDEKTWFNYTGDGSRTKIFNGNSHPLIVEPNPIEPSVTARYVRINPVNWNQKPCLRLELYRCTIKDADRYEL